MRQENRRPQERVGCEIRHHFAHPLGILDLLAKSFLLSPIFVVVPLVRGRAVLVLVRIVVLLGAAVVLAIADTVAASVVVLGLAFAFLRLVAALVLAVAARHVLVADAVLHDPCTLGPIRQVVVPDLSVTFQVYFPLIPVAASVTAGVPLALSFVDGFD